MIIASCVRVSALVSLTLAACSTADPHGEPGDAAANATQLRSLCIDDVHGAEVEELRATGNASVQLPWWVPLTREDVRAAWAICKDAERTSAAPATMFILSLNGVIHTTAGDYRFDAGEEKTAAGTYRVSLDAIGEPSGREALHWTLPAQQGRQLLRLLRERVLANHHLGKRRGYISKPK